jgi:hypothetical protein
MNKLALRLAFTAILLGTHHAFPAVVISEATTPSSFTSNTSADHNRLYGVNTANVGDWPGWYINSLTVSALTTTSSSFDPSSDTFTLRFYNSSGVRIGSEYTDTSTSALSSTTTFGRYFFSVTFDLPTEAVIVPDASTFYYSIASAAGLNLFLKTGSTNYGNGWGIGPTWFGSVGGSYLGNSTPGLTLDATMVPEPSAISLMAVGLGVLFRRSRKRV